MHVQHIYTQMVTNKFKELLPVYICYTESWLDDWGNDSALGTGTQEMPTAMESTPCCFAVC